MVESTVALQTFKKLYSPLTVDFGFFVKRVLSVNDQGVVPVGGAPDFRDICVVVGF